MGYFYICVTNINAKTCIDLSHYMSNDIMCTVFKLNIMHLTTHTKKAENGHLSIARSSIVAM